MSEEAGSEDKAIERLVVSLLRTEILCAVALFISLPWEYAILSWVAVTTVVHIIIAIVFGRSSGEPADD